MKKTFILGLVFAAAAVGAACNQAADNTATNHGAMDHNSMPMNAGNQSNQNRMMNSNNQMNHDKMDHSQMTSDPSAADAPYDLQFIDTMSHHHQGAIEMAETALRKSENAELKKFAQKIIDDQQKEIAQMKQWRDRLFPEGAPSKNMEMPGMSDSAKTMGAMMEKMKAANGKEFDPMFLEMMIPHHRDAVKMSEIAMQMTERPEIKTFANSIIKAQESEIKQMNDWKAKWTK